MKMIFKILKFSNRPSVIFPSIQLLDAALFSIGSASGQTTKASKVYHLII
jgi:hypothetical protein